MATGSWEAGMAARGRVDLSAGALANVGRAGVGEHGYAMAALLVALGVMSVMLLVLLPAWSTQAKREKEAELIFRGEQYARAIRLFMGRRGGGVGVLPPNVDVLVREKFLRKKYKDPMTGDDFVVVAPGAAAPGVVGQPVGPRGGTPNTGPGAGAAPARGGTAPAQGAGRGRAGTGATTAGATTGVAGVASSSTDTSLRVYNGRTRYNEWIFMPVQGTTAAGRGGARGSNQPGLPGAGGRGASAPGPAGRGQQLPPGGRGRSGP